MKSIIAGIFLASLAGPVFADATVLIEQADHLYAARTETTGAAEAVAVYEQAIQADPNSVEALWKAGRAAHWLGDHGTVKKEKVAALEKGIGFCQLAIQLNPKSVESHFWLAALWGTLGETKGIMKSLALVKPIRKELETINRLDDRFQGGGGYRVQGIVDYKVPGIAGGSKKRALEELNKALAIDPSNAFNQYYSAEYFFTVGDKKTAREHLDTLKSLMVTADVDAANLMMVQKKGEKLRAQLGT